MITSMLVGVSGTQFSHAAAEHAIQLAGETGAVLIGLGVVDRPHLCAAESVPLGAGQFKHERDEIVLKSAHERVGELLDEFQRRCDQAGVVSQSLKLEGDPAEILCIESQRVDLLVVGKKHLHVEDWEDSSHTLWSILHQAPRPVLCVPAAHVHRRTVLIAYDGSLQAARALQLFVNSGLAAKRAVHLLTVGEQPEATARRALEYLDSHKIHVQPHLEDGIHAQDHVLQLAASLNAGHIVMGAYGRPRFREFIFGSVTKAVLWKTTIPVFLYH
jgi:nucleotide-binding universal stress UspA family protein